MFPGGFKKVQGSFNSVLSKFQEPFKEVSGKFQGCYCFKGVSRKKQGPFKYFLEGFKDI